MSKRNSKFELKVADYTNLAMAILEERGLGMVDEGRVERLMRQMLSQPFHPLICPSCNRPVKYNFYGDEHDPEEDQTLHITLEGGYNGFVDTAGVIGRRPYRYTLCHECAFYMLSQFGMREAIRQHLSDPNCWHPGKPYGGPNGPHWPERKER